MRGIVIAVLLAACGGSGSGGGGGGAPLTQDELVTGCVLFGSCVGGDGINDCFTDVAPQVPPDVWRCVIAAGSDCVASRACLGIEFSTVATCTEGCDGDTVVECDGNAQFRIACSSPFLFGPHCFVDNFGNADCGAAMCTAASQTCDGAVAQRCNPDSGILGEVDCGARNLTCINGECTSPGGGAACSDAPRHCAGSAVEDCSDGTTVQLDCPSLFAGSTCTAITTPSADAYCGYGSACQPDKGAETCAGNNIVFCAAGVPDSIDCTSLGFAQCLGSRCVTL